MDMTGALPALFAAAVVFSLPATASAQWSPSLPIIIVNPSPTFGGWGPGMAAPAWGWGWNGYATGYGCYPTFDYSTGWNEFCPGYGYVFGTGLFSYPGYGYDYGAYGYGYGTYGYGYGTAAYGGYYAYQPGVRRDWR